VTIKGYDRYVLGGCDLVEQTPAHWPILRLRFAVDLNPSARKAYLDPGQEVAFLPMEAIGEDGSIDLSRTCVVSEASAGYSHFANGDVVLAKITPCFENGKAAVLHGLFGGHGFGTTELIVMRPIRALMLPRFLYYVVHSSAFRDLGTAHMYGAGGQKRLPDEFVRNLRVGLPPIAEQQAIVAFLDRETSNIDFLVAEQRRLMELLQEKRQAVISHAVTKGLNPDSATMPSRIDWMGEIPESWTTQRLKHVSPRITVGIVVNPSSYISDSGLPFIYGGDIREGEIAWRNARRISAEASDSNRKTRLCQGDLLCVRVGAPGVTAVVPPECEGGNCASVMLIRRGDFNSQWLCYVMNARIVRDQVAMVQYGAAQEQFNIGHAVDFWIPVPPCDQQSKIVEHLDKKATIVSGLIGEAQRAVALLLERRTALISAAVTGQLDVRQLPRAEAA
jgi:type I restriction enzyme S subunit